MPLKFKKRSATSRYTRKYRKRTHRKKANSYKKSYRSLTKAGLGTTVSGSPFPAIMNTKLTYAQTFSLSFSTIGVTGAVQDFSLNGMYDPDITGTGHQPYAFDQLMAIYGRYKVHGAKVTLTIYDPTEDGVGFYFKINNPVTYNTTMYNKAVDYVSEQPGVGKLVINNTGNQRVTRSFYVDIGQVAGLTRLQFKADPDGFTGSASGNPGSAVYLQFCAGNTRTSNSATLAVRVQCTYYASFYDRLVLGTS